MVGFRFICFFLFFWGVSSVVIVENFKSQAVIFAQEKYIDGFFIFNKNRDEYGFTGKAQFLGVSEEITFVEHDKVVKEVISGQCRTNPYLDLSQMFDWIEYAKEIGVEIIADQKCKFYELFIESQNETLQLCINDDSFPVYFGLLVNGVIISSFTFTNQSEGDYPMVYPSICAVPLNFCEPEDPVIQTKSMTRFHTKGDYSLANENTATMMGDVFFICYSMVHNASSSSKTINNNGYNYQDISIFEVSVNTTYGQYSLCNDRMCVGGVEGTVGREVAMGNKPWGGQCAENDVQGSWFSLLERDMCNETQEVGDWNPESQSVCAWKLKSVQKTIEYSCLVQHGFEQACVKDWTPPFTNSFNIIQKAFESDDISQGGCPNIYTQQ